MSERLIPLSTMFEEPGNPGSEPFSAMLERFGISFAVRAIPRGTGTSPNAATVRPQDGGAFRAFADGGDIKSGDGRAPKVSKPKLPKRKP